MSTRLRIAVASAAAIAVVFWYFADESYSNIYPADYVGPDACRECHEDNHDDNYESWRGHAHRRMNQDASEESVVGNFSGVRLDYGRGHAIFDRDGEDFRMSIYEGDRLLRRHRVTRTVGSLYMQYYIGKQVEGPEPADHASYRLETKLPFVYSFTLERWLPEIYLDSTVAAEREYLPGGKQTDYIYAEAPTHAWNASCLTCHNTYPYVARLWKQAGPLAGEVPWRGGFSEADVEWHGTELHQGNVPLGSRLRALDRDELVTVGISCESCHFGGREHAVEEKPIRFVPTAPELVVRDPRNRQPLESDRKDPFVINAICSQCHNAQLKVFADGSPAVNSNEATALTGGACRSVIKCTDCHNPHEAGLPSGSPDIAGYVEACVRCHAALEAPAQRARHTRHGPSVSCLDCHMPRTVAGLDTVVRSHRITTPGDPRMTRSRGPNACGLCHLDRSIAWTHETLQRDWGFATPRRAKLESWYGDDLDRPQGSVWLESKSPFVRLVAVGAYARAPQVSDRISPILTGLLDGHAFNRTLGLIALERVVGRRISEQEYSLLAAPETRNLQVTALARSLRAIR